MSIKYSFILPDRFKENLEISSKVIHGTSYIEKGFRFYPGF